MLPGNKVGTFLVREAAGECWRNLCQFYILSQKIVPYIIILWSFEALSKRCQHFISKICRYSFSDKASYVLSIRDHDPKTNDACVKHYRIRKMDNGGFYISPRRTFPSMIKLIDHYQSKKKQNICSTYTEEKRCIGVNAQLISSSNFLNFTR